VDKRHFTSVSQYIAAQPREVQGLLKRVRTTIRKAVPKARESISYNIPAYKLHDGTVIYFAGWKKHFSVYPANARLVAAFKDELAAYEVNNKGTIRFPIAEPPPMKLIAALARFRAREVRKAERVR
jgi:uncharacterized protein YdhG (YjbR/CyaY superfamily)